jgi:hypothetical protein
VGQADAGQAGVDEAQQAREQGAADPQLAAGDHVERLAEGGGGRVGVAVAAGAGVEHGEAFVVVRLGRGGEDGEAGGVALPGGVLPEGVGAAGVEVDQHQPVAGAAPGVEVAHPAGADGERPRACQRSASRSSSVRMRSGSAGLMEECGWVSAR